MSDCALNGNNLFALLGSQNATLPTLSSELVAMNSVSTVIISGLSIRLIYNLTIVSNNSLGVSFSESQQFCKCMQIWKVASCS